MEPKRKRVVLSVKEKLIIIDRLEKGESGKKLAKEYGIGSSTISDIKKNADSLKIFVSKIDNEEKSSSRKSMKKPMNNKVEDAVYTWFLQRRSQGQLISGSLLSEKALIFNQKLGGEPQFKASQGWLRNFKERHGIRELEMYGSLYLIEKEMSANKDAADNYVSEFMSKYAGQYDRDFIYNADETGLYWKSLPNNTLISKLEFKSPSHKTSKDRVTLLSCANSTGSHKLPLLMIGKSKEPRAFKIVKNLPVVYTNQQQGWMNCNIFLQWYDTCFVPQVKKFQEDIGKDGKVLLLLDNAPSHPSPEWLERDNGKFSVIFLPPNVTNLIQPMEQGVIDLMKRIYRKTLLCKLLLFNDLDQVIDCYNRINLKECAYMSANTWDQLKPIIIKRAWQRIMREEESENYRAFEITNDELFSIASQIPGSSQCEVEDIAEWLASDSSDPDYQLMTYNDIVDSFLNVETSEEESENEGELEEINVPSHNDAFQCLKQALDWMEDQEECDATQLLQVKRVLDLAAKKKSSSK